MHVALAQLADLPAWLDLAAEVEFLFGPTVADPGFHAALERNIARQTAFCIREQDGAPGAPLMGALLFSSTHAPHYKIGWLAVAQRWRRQGVAQALVEHCFHLIQPPADLSVVTFGEDNLAGRLARRFYERMGFRAAEAVPNGPEGGRSSDGSSWSSVLLCAIDSAVGIAPLFKHQQRDERMGFDPIITSFFAPEALAQRIEAAYGFQNVRCQLITATLRDVYLVESPAGRHILIVYRHDQRTRDEIVAEWQFVDYLARQAVPVAPAIATTTGEQILTLQAPESSRYAVVTTYVPGQHLRRRPSAEATRRYGAIIATIHLLADRASVSFARTTHDIAARLNQALVGIQAVLGDGLTERAYLEQCVRELQTRLQTLTKETPAYGIIHGDVIRANALVADDLACIAAVAV